MLTVLITVHKAEKRSAEQKHTTKDMNKTEILLNIKWLVGFSVIVSKEAGRYNVSCMDQ